VVDARLLLKPRDLDADLNRPGFPGGLQRNRGGSASSATRQGGWPQPLLALTLSQAACDTKAVENSHMRYVSLALAAMLVSVAIPAGASVLCQKRSGVVVVRDVCKKKELPLDLSSFGAVGAQGPRGLPGEPGPPGPGVATLVGAINADGTPQASPTKYTSARIETGAYTITFPAGTWASAPICVVMPIGSNVVVDTIFEIGGNDGSAVVQIELGADILFNFICADFGV
jgi:hypothetical protein